MESRIITTERTAKRAAAICCQMDRESTVIHGSWPRKSSGGLRRERHYAIFVPIRQLKSVLAPSGSGIWTTAMRGSRRLTRARDAIRSDQLLEIADDVRLEPNDRRVRLDVRRWLMSKLNPAKYGDTVTVAGDADHPLQHVVSVIDLQRLSNAELNALARFADAWLAAQDVSERGN